ncbi:MAG: cupin domain-containing protein [Nakamurella sp.]
MLGTDQLGASGPTGRPQFPARAAPALARCIAISADDFARRYWSNDALLTSAAELGSDFADLFSAAAVDELISAHGLRTPFLRMAKNGSVLASAAFTRSGGVGAGIADQVADDKVLAQLAGGATLVLQALHRTWPPLIHFGTQLAAELGHPVQINAYITPPENQGFAAHYDTHDVFVLQVAGSKRWTIHEPVLEHPLPGQTWEQRKSAVADKAKQAPLIDTVLTPGDALYLPRGYLHSAVAQGEVSIHLTVGVHPVTAYDLAKELISAASADAELRQSLPMGLDTADLTALTDLVRTAAKRLTVAVNSADDDLLMTVARKVNRQQASAVRPAPLPPLAQLDIIRTLDSNTQLIIRPGLRPSIRTTGERLVLEVLDTTMNWPAQTEAALQKAFSGSPFRPGELPELDADEQLVVARRLLREGLVMPTVSAAGKGERAGPRLPSA